MRVLFDEFSEGKYFPSLVGFLHMLYYLEDAYTVKIKLQTIIVLNSVYTMIILTSPIGEINC